VYFLVVLFDGCANYNYEVEGEKEGGACSMKGEKRNAYRLLVGKPQRKKPQRRRRRRWVGNIKMHLDEIEWVDVGWICLAQNRNEWRVLVNAVTELWVP
jgi:hypothetical protein